MQIILKSFKITYEFEDYSVLSNRIIVDRFDDKNKNAVVRLYALQALRQKHIRISDNLLKQFQHDNTIVMILKGCNGIEMSVSEAARQHVHFTN